MSPFAKTVAGGAIVVACAVATGLSARGLHQAPPESAPAFREKGPENAKVTIVEFSDFQCPACRAAEEPLKQVLELYGKDTRLIFKQFPLERVHRNARAAALAAECMGKQGKFWGFHDELYKNQDAWGELEDPRPLLDKFERDNGADLAALKACEADPATAASIAADQKEARDRWVAATPTFFVNGRRFVGGRQLSMRAPSWIEKELKRK